MRRLNIWRSCCPIQASSAAITSPVPDSSEKSSKRWYQKFGQGQYVKLGSDLNRKDMESWVFAAISPLNSRPR